MVRTFLKVYMELGHHQHQHCLSPLRSKKWRVVDSCYSGYRSFGAHKSKAWLGVDVSGRATASGSPTLGMLVDMLGCFMLVVL